MPAKQTKSEPSIQIQNHWVEFKSLKDLFSFVITKSMPGQQFLSVIKYRDFTYVFTPVSEAGVMVFYTKEAPQSPAYAWDSDNDKFIPVHALDRTRLNILVQEVVQDTLIESLFYPAGK